MDARSDHLSRRCSARLLLGVRLDHEVSGPPQRRPAEESDAAPPSSSFPFTAYCLAGKSKEVVRER